MKSLKYLVILFAMIALIPFVVNAEGEEVTSQDDRAIVYFFRGEGCSHCAEAEAWFESIQEEYGSKFKIVDYEVWNNTENAALMQKVSEGRGDNASGVPYIIVGDKSWIGFDNTTMAPEILAAIDEVYATEVSARYDAIALFGDAKVEEKKSNDVLALIIILVVACGVGYGIFRARKATN